MASITHADIYAEVRAYMLGLFSCPPETIIQSQQQYKAFPDDAIVMSILSEQALDMANSYYQPANDKVIVQQSVQVNMQVEFYGEMGAERARKLCNLWQNQYTVDRLHCCQPLYCECTPQRDCAPDKKLQQGWQVVLTLQYNPEFELDQVYLEKPEITLINL